MRQVFQIALFFSLLGLLAGRAAAQAPGAGKIVNILRADSLTGVVVKGVNLKRLVGNVALQQGNVLLNADLVLQNEAANTLQAFGNVRIVQADSVTITGDTATYNGNTRFAKMTGRRVVLNDGTITLTTRRLDYNLTSHVAYYTGGGTIVDKQSTLTSREGTYNTELKLFTYRGDVRVVDPQSTITADSLRYNSLSKEAFFIAPTTKIVSKDDTLYAKPGSVYNTRTRTSNFRGRSQYSSPKYDLTADTLIYDPPTKIAIAHGNVVFVSRPDSAILTGREGRNYGQSGLTRVWGNALLRNISKGDTLYLAADTLVARETITPIDTLRRLFAYRAVRIFRRDFQGKCDSLAYYVNDSTLYFYKKPVLWSTDSQSEGDSVRLFLKNGRISSLLLQGKAFVISLDTLRNFNQMKGRRITSFLNNENKLERVLVEGNAESIYFALDDKKKLIGMNRVECARMTLSFRQGEVKRIAFVGKPESSLTPPAQITPANRELDGFIWREKLRPTKQQVIEGRIPKETVQKPVPKRPTVAPAPTRKPAKSTPKTRKTPPQPMSRPIAGL
jgi:lipopolysaccharide export system protein LptA